MRINLFPNTPYREGIVFREVVSSDFMVIPEHASAMGIEIIKRA